MQLAIITVGYKCENLNGSEHNIEKMYPTGQNYSLELMFAKFATAKNCEELNPHIKFSRCFLPEHNNGEGC